MLERTSDSEWKKDLPSTFISKHSGAVHVIREREAQSFRGKRHLDKASKLITKLHTYIVGMLLTVDGVQTYLNWFRDAADGQVLQLSTVTFAKRGSQMQVLFLSGTESSLCFYSFDNLITLSVRIRTNSRMPHIVHYTDTKPLLQNQENTLQLL